MSDSDEERAPGVLLSRRASGCQQHVTQTPSTLRAPRRKEVPRDFLKGKIEKFTMKLERAKYAGNSEAHEPRETFSMVSCSGACAPVNAIVYQHRVD